MWYLLLVGFVALYFITGLIRNIIYIYEYFKSVDDNKYKKYKKLQG